MLTYSEVMTTDLGLLTTAADKWESMAGKIKKVEERYRDTVQKVSMGTNWTGISAGVARTNFAGTRYEYAAAQIQAKAVAALLRDAHSQFTDLKKRIESVRADAVKEGLVVDAQGNVRQDESKLTGQDRMYLRDHPEAVAARNKAIEAWAQRIKDLVQAFADADQGVKVALEAVGVDSNKDAFGKGNDDQLNGFNAGAQGDIEVYEARNAEDIATRINSGEKVSAADYAELNRSFRDNSSRPEFTQTFLNGMGAENTLKFTNKLNDHAYGDDKGNKQRYLDLQKGLANALSNAMQDPKSEFYKNFRTQLNSAGLATYDLTIAGEAVNTVANGHGQKVHGYQSLVTLMQQGEGYSGAFLQDLATDIRKAEDKKQGGNPDIWDLYGDYNGRERNWFANDPLDGILGIMGRDPATSTAYLDPGPDGKNDNLHYLLKERDWDIANTTHWRGNIEIDGADKADTDSRVGLGAALEAATTGHKPLGPNQDPWPVTPHTDAQARVMHDIIGELGPSQKVHENLSEPLARSLASYTSDTHEILAGLNADYASASGTGYFQSGGTTHMSASQKDLVQFIRGLSDDPEAYATLHKAESRYSSLVMEGIPRGATGDDLTNPLYKSGSALGVYSSVMEDVINDERMTEYSKADWKAKVAYHVIGGAVTPLYFTTAGGVSVAFGDSIQRGVDTWAWQLGNEMKAAADTEANAKIADKYLEVNHQVPIMVNDWAADRPDLREQTVEALSRHILDGHDRSVNTAQKYLTDTTN
ncbi:hypothetical protein [Streptomyces yangpuensis]